MPSPHCLGRSEGLCKRQSPVAWTCRKYRLIQYLGNPHTLQA